MNWWRLKKGNKRVWYFKKENKRVWYFTWLRRNKKMEWRWFSLSDDFVSNLNRQFEAAMNSQIVPLADFWFAEKLLSVWFHCFKYFHEFGWFSKYTAHRPQNLSRHSQCLNILYIRTFQFYRSCWMERGFFEAATNNICWQSFYRKKRERDWHW